METAKTIKIEVESAEPKLKADGSEIKNRYDRKLYLVKAKGIKQEFETWSDTIGMGVGKTFEVEVEKKENEYNGKTYTNYFIKQTQDSSKRGGFGGGGPREKSIDERRSIEKQVSLKEANLFHKDREKATSEDVLKMASEYYNWLITAFEPPKEEQKELPIAEDDAPPIGDEDIDMNEIPF